VPATRHPTASCRMTCFLSSCQVMSRHRELMDCRDWRLVITGHSLGAGAAALVALYVHNFFPKCVCSPAYWLRQSAPVLPAMHETPQMLMFMVKVSTLRSDSPHEQHTDRALHPSTVYRVPAKCKCWAVCRPAGSSAGRSSRRAGS